MRLPVATIGEAISVPVILLDGERGVLYANSSAHKLLDGRFHLKLQSERLLVTESNLNSHFQAALAEITRNGRQHSVALPLHSDASGRRAILHLASAPSEDDADDTSQKLVFIGIVSFARELEPQELTRLRETFGLSESEAEVAAFILAGKSPREIARRRGTSLQTVRWHIKNIHTKTHTRRLTDLVLQIQAVRSPF